MYCTSDLYIYILFDIAYDYGKLLLLILYHDNTYTNSDTTTTLLLDSTTCLVISYGIHRLGILHLLFWLLRTHVLFILKQAHLHKSTFQLHRFSSSTTIIQYLHNLNRRQREKGLDLLKSDNKLGIPILKDNIRHQYFMRPVGRYLLTLRFFPLMVKMTKFGYETLWYLDCSIPWVPIPFRNQERTCIKCFSTVNSRCCTWSTCMQMIQCFSKFLLL